MGDRHTLHTPKGSTPPPRAPHEGREVESIGPSDSSDSGSDLENVGGYDAGGTLPYAGNFAYRNQAGINFLVFTEDIDAIEASGLILTLAQEGPSDGYILQYDTEDLVIPAATCEWDITRNDATGAAGSFTCNDQIGFGSDQQAVQGIDITGSFEANQ